MEDLDAFLAEVEGNAPVEDRTHAAQGVAGVPARASDRERDRGTARRLRRDRIAFYAGAILTAIGAWGFALGSVLHDVLRVPWFGTAFTTFGPLNAAAAAIGGVLLVAGLAGLGFGLRGGVVRPSSDAEG